MNSSARCKESGITLFEVLIYTMLTLVVGGQLAQLIRVSVRASRESDAINRVTERNRVAMFRVAQELRSCIGSTLSITNSGRTLTFAKENGYDGAAVIPGAMISYRLVSATGETASGSDDNDNGLVDEGRLVRDDVSAGTSSTLCESLDLTKCQFSTSGTGVTISMSSMAYLPDSGSVLGIDRSLTVYPRN
jgi:hypothetical protein